MDIDLLISKNGDVCLVSTGRFKSPVTAAIFDHETQEMSLEFGETMESMDLNIPVSHDIISYLSQKDSLFIIGTDKVHIHEAFRIPLMHLNDFKSQNVGEW